jgi:hypothetical protein
MLLGIVAAAFMVPRSTPLLTFGIINGAVFVLANALLIRQKTQVRDGQPLSPEQKRNLNLIIVAFGVYWMICFLLRH